ncbi:hypothetical protein PhaeoP83_02853 [Phaeobacter inhibens]|uniref:Uncharacterized protein n=1 Tax=Phaeobacter inhibens TaxID=221822 RepID=A0ABM6RGU2_9RHOB|nr:hypothetical protein [Phaeobacter inhibens]AUQ51102.1 hypothetical protein PhaeoP83_02853 [Phaeobacter inhibens]AUQ95621.1 hypothetical protein PhaeoP66_02864 [Phaeobacter inhibens]AUR20907.1 hypothetical protein PhaeoP80_02853 [Phaeobacter inhibens]
MSDKEPLTIEENAAVRKMLREAQAIKRQATNDLAAQLTKDLERQYGPLVR